MAEKIPKENLINFMKGSRNLAISLNRFGLLDLAKQAGDLNTEIAAELVRQYGE